MPVSAGQYRHRIKILKLKQTKDKYGGLTKDSTQVARPWCKIKVISDTENVDTQTVGQTKMEFEIRYSKSLENPTSDMFIEFKGNIYDITGVINVLEINEKLLISAIKRK